MLLWSGALKFPTLSTLQSDGEDDKDMLEKEIDMTIIVNIFLK